MPSSPSATERGRAGWLRGLEIAHRGLHGGGTPENSPAAFVAAIAAGLAIECDVQLTADDEAVVFHDFALDRLVGRPGAVVERTAAQLATLRLTGTDQAIPSLASMLALVASRAPLLIELKSRRHWPVARLCAAVERALAGYPGQVAVMSFDPRVPRWFARHAPTRARGLVLSEVPPRWLRRLRLRWAVGLATPDFLAVDVHGLPGGIAAAARRRGLPVATWTVRTATDRALALTYADAVIGEGEGLPAPSPTRSPA